MKVTDLHGNGLGTGVVVGPCDFDLSLHNAPAGSPMVRTALHRRHNPDGRWDDQHLSSHNTYVTVTLLSFDKVRASLCVDGTLRMVDGTIFNPTGPDAKHLCPFRKKRVARSTPLML